MVIEAPDNKAVIDFLGEKTVVTITVENGHMNIEAKMFPDNSYSWQTKSVSWKLPKQD